jgi:ABC-type nitrate/sulfonate/bicarbonate transport system substrate-binding protein
VNQLSHYLVMVALRDKLKARRESYVKLVAALIDATRFTLDAKNLDRVAQIASVTGRTPKIAKETLPRFARIELWPVGNDGLAKENLDAVVATEKELGGIKPGKTPVAYEKLVDRTVWKDASALAGK